MNFDDVRIEVRPRSPFEAIDLGFVMARQWFIPMWLIWISMAVPVYVAAHLLFYFLAYKYIFVAGIILWWLKPVYEKPIVLWLSRAFFNEKISFKEIAQQYFTINKLRLFADLTYLRFSPNRSFLMPVAVLEKLKGKDYANRVRTLGHNQTAGIGLTLVCIVFNTVLNLSILLLVFFLLPEDLQWTSFEDLIMSRGFLQTLFLRSAAIISMSVVAPFYIAAGFALYINRRTELEAWDIEISFKRLMTRKAKKEQNNRKIMNKTLNVSIGVFCLFASSFILFSDPVYASYVSSEKASITINKVIDHSDFGKKETTTSWKLKEFDKVDFDLPQWLKDFLESLGFENKWAQNIPKFTGIILEILAWIGGGLAVVFLLYKIGQKRQFFKYDGRNSKKVGNTPSKLFGLDLSKESLPDDVMYNVREFLNKNEIRNALSLLYRGTLVKLVNEFSLKIPKSATENECVKLVMLKREKAEIKFFKKLTEAWLTMAYGNILPEREMLEEVCQNWEFLYGKF